VLDVRRRFVAATVAAMRAISAVAAPALAGDCPPPPPEGKAKCDAGNGSESLANTGHCFMGDPGNFYNAGNRGGDDPDLGRCAEPGRQQRVVASPPGPALRRARWAV
jgi:hypothetical protein